MKIYELGRFRFLILSVLVFVGGLSEGWAQFKGSGTGFFITSKGHIVTNWHVVENHPDLAIITQNDELYTAKLKAAHKDVSGQQSRPWHFRHSAGISGCYAASHWSWAAPGVRCAATQFTGRRASSSSSGGSCMSFSKTHSR